MQQRKFVTLVLSLMACLCMSINVLGAAVSDFDDIPNDWSHDVIVKAIENDFINDYGDGRIAAHEKITVAETLTVIANVFSANQKGDIGEFVKIRETDWYYKCFQLAKGMDILDDDALEWNPDELISRQQAICLYANALDLKIGDLNSLGAYTDAAQIAEKYKPRMAAMVSNKYLQGNDGKLTPTEPLSRAEFYQIVNNTANTFIKSEGEYSTFEKGNVMVKTGNTILKNAKVEGDLIIADSVGEGVVTLDNTAVSGRILVRGGKLVIKGNINNVVVAQTASVTVQSGKVNTLEISSNAQGSFVNVSKNAIIDTVNVNTSGIKISGYGTVDIANVNGNKTKVSTNDTNVVVARGVIGTVVSGKAIADGTITSTASLSSSGGSGSKSNSGSSSRAAMTETVVIDGKRFYYGTGKASTVFTVNGNTITATPVNTAKTVFKYTEETNLPTVVYATKAMTYAQYYYGELTNKGITATKDTLVNASAVSKLTAFEQVGMYDAVTSATSKGGSHSADYPEILNYRAGGDSLETDPMTIDGIDVVDVLIPYDLYVNAKIMNETGAVTLAGKEVKLLTLTDTAPAYAKALMGDGVYAKAQAVTAAAADTTLSSAGMTGTVSYTSNYGEYAVKLVLNKYTNSAQQSTEFKEFLKQMYSIVIEDARGNQYGGVHYEDIWCEGSHFGYVDFVLSNGEFRANGKHTFLNNRFAGIFKDGIIEPGNYKIIVKARGYEDISTTVSIGRKMDTTAKITIANGQWGYGETTIPVVSTLPADYNLNTVMLTKGSGTAAVVLVRDTDYTWNSVSKELKIIDNDKTRLGSYTFRIEDAVYAPVSATFTLTSDLTQAQIALSGKQLVITNNTHVTIADYIMGITRVNVKLEGSTGSGVNLSTTGAAAIKVFDANGLVDTTIQSNSTPVFEEGNRYILTITSTGHTSIVVILDLTDTTSEPGLKDGDYTGSAVVSGYNGSDEDYEVYVRIIIEGGVITAIEDITDYNNDEIADENASYISRAFEGYKKSGIYYPGVIDQMLTGGKAVDEVDAVSGATYSTKSIKTAITNALAAAGSTPIALAKPDLLPFDNRTEFIFASNSGARLIIENPNQDSDIYYTEDGTSPLDLGNATKATSLEVTIHPNTIAENSIANLKVIAAKSGNYSSVLDKNITFAAANTENGTKKYKGSAPCSYGYDAQVIITTVNGKITEIKDNITQPTITNAVYWNGAINELTSGPKSLIGKNIEEVCEIKTKPNGTPQEKVDAVSGATVSSNALKYAVVHALMNRPYYISENTVQQPIIKTQDNVRLFPNVEGETAQIAVSVETGATAYYTLDDTTPTSASQEVLDGNIVINANSIANPDGEIITIKVIAVKDGDSSDISEMQIVFANKIKDGVYATGEYSLRYNPAQALDAVVTTNHGYITEIAIIPNGNISDEVLEIMNKKLIPEILLAQSAQVLLVGGTETASQMVIDAVQYHLNAAFSDMREQSSTPTIAINDVQTKYNNEDELLITLETSTPDARIYYTIDYSYNISQYLSDPKNENEDSTRILYTDPFSVNINNVDGGTVYIRAVAISDTTQYSEIARKDLAFRAKIAAGAFDANGIICSTFSQAVDIINASPNGGTITINDNVELLENDLKIGMPTKPCVITSTSSQTLKGKTTPLIANSNLTFENITLDFHAIYANGFDLTMEEGVITAYSIIGTSLYAGCSYTAGQSNIITANPQITIKSGEFIAYASGKGSTTLDGDVTLNIEGTSMVNIVGADMKAIITGDAVIWIDGDGVTFSSFMGEYSGGNIKGVLSLMIIGNPIVASWNPTYKSSVNKIDFGLVFLYDSILPETLFVNFEDILVLN